MKCLAVIFALIAAAYCQLAAWPATSYSPFYQALYSGAAAPAFAAPVAAAPAYAAAPVVAAAPAYAPAPVAAAPVVAAAPAVVPAYSPFQTAAYFIGSNKGKSGVKA